MAEYGEPLTEREIEILQLVATGVTNREVAYKLNISVNTVKVHLRNVFNKLGAESRTEATMIAVCEGWVVIEGAEQPSESEGTSEEETTIRLQSRPLAPAPALPRFKRVLLISAILLAVGGVAVTWPRNSTQAGNWRNSRFGEPSEQLLSVPGEDTESDWHEQAPMPTRRAYLALVTTAGRILAIGGRTPEGVTSAVEAYDPTTEIWTSRRNKPTPVAYVSAGEVDTEVGTEVIVPGGCDAEGSPTRVVEAYDVLNDTWRAVSPLPKPRCAYALASMDGRLYLLGGWDGTRYASTVYAYDPEQDIWTEQASLDAGRGFAAAASLGQRIYVVGGDDGDRELPTCTVYDPATGTSEGCAQLTVGRSGLGLVALGGQLYAIGGGALTSFLGFNERYRPGDNTWHPIGTPRVGQWHGPGVAVFETSISAIGGQSNDYLSLNQAFDPFPFRTFIPMGYQQ